MYNVIRKLLRNSLFLRRLVGYHVVSSGLFDSLLRRYKLSESWEKRILTTLESPDLARLSYVNDAGKLRRGRQIMHNGLKIYVGSYYGPEYTQLFIKSKGVHEPQEEVAFKAILNKIPEGGTMIELGAFWSFYSMWFNKEIPNARNLMVEPDLFNLGQGKRNFELNGMKGQFLNAFVGKVYKSDKTDTISVDYLMEKYDIKKLHILHSDIQGYELDMLEGASKSLENDLICFTFISTHTNELHSACITELENHNHEIIWEYNLDQSYSQDGLIVSKSPSVSYNKEFELSKRQK